MNFTLKLFLMLTVVYIKDVHTECNEDASEEYEIQDPSSLNSESYEAFNVSSKENLIDSEDISEMENETMAIHNGKEESNKLSIGAGPLIKAAEIYKENSTSKVPDKTIRKKIAVNYPFSVSIQRKWSHYTSGALVDKQWVLTSAGGFYNVRESIKIFRVRLGSVNCKKGGISVPIKQVEVHPSYVPNKPGFDIALLKLAVPVEYDHFVAPIAISKIRGRVLSAKFLATYWPRLIVKGHVLPASAKERIKQYSMRVSTQQLIPWDKCHKLMEHNNVTLEPSSHCLEPIISHHSPCMPDPGAPVIAKDGLWGVTSGWTGKHCPRSGSATVFTRLSSPRVHSWLQLLLVDL